MTDDAERAARLSKVPGVTIAEACKRFGVTRAAIGKARKGLRLSVAELAVASLTENGTKPAGAVAELAGVAGWLDYVDHASYSTAEIRTLVADHVAFDGERWKLVTPWP